MRGVMTFTRLLNGALFIVVSAGALCSSVASAATEDEKLADVRNGLAHLYATQTNGLWGAGANETAATGAAAFALLSQKDKWGKGAENYQAVTDEAVAWLLTSAHAAEVSRRADGSAVCPGATASCRAVYWSGASQPVRATAMALSAFAYYAEARAGEVATTKGPLAGLTWTEIAQGVVNALAASQSSLRQTRGGWGAVIPGDVEPDADSTYSAVVALSYAAKLRAVIPETAREDLKVWVAATQNSSGALCDRPGGQQCGVATTGGGLLIMAFAGYDAGATQVKSALKFLNDNWNARTSDPLTTHFGQPNAMWEIHNGLGATIGLTDDKTVVNLRASCSDLAQAARRDPSGRVACTWSEDYAEWIATQEKQGGLWTDAPTVAAYVSILGGVRVPLPALSERPGGAASPLSSAQSSLAIPLLAPTLTDAAAVPQQAAGKIRAKGKKGVVGLTVSGDGGLLATGGSDDTIRIFAPTTGRQQIVLSAAGKKLKLTNISFLPGGSSLASVGLDSVVRLWDTTRGKEQADLSGHSQGVRALAVSPDGSLLATGGDETRVMLWDTARGKLKNILVGATDFVNSIAFSPDSRLVACGQEDARISVFDVGSGKPIFTLRGHSGAIDTVVFRKDGTLLASGGQDTVIRLWDPAKGVQVRALKGHSQPINTIVFSPDGTQIASGGDDGKILLWDAATGALRKTLTNPGGAVNALVFDPAGRFLASVTSTGQLILWDVGSASQLLTVPIPVAP